jgi:hypothetical protein
MTVVNADLYQALRAANVPEELAQKAAAAAGGGIRRRGIALAPVIWPLALGGGAIAAGLALGWLLTSALPALPALPAGPATVRCFSNGQVIYEGRSEGAVDRGWSGIAFRDATGHRTRIRGDCVIVYD